VLRRRRRRKGERSDHLWGQWDGFVEGWECALCDYESALLGAPGLWGSGSVGIGENSRGICGEDGAGVSGSEEGVEGRRDALVEYGGFILGW